MDKLISYYIHIKHCGVIAIPCPNFDGGLLKRPLELGMNA